MEKSIIASKLRREGGHSQARFHTGGSFNYTRHIVVIALLTLPMVIVFCEVFLWILILISGLKI